MELYHNYHGGDCCGRRHLFGFDQEDADGDPYEFDAADIRETLREKTGGKNLLTEIVLNQFQRQEYEAEVLAAGFKLVADWINGNTNHRCYAYFYAPEWNQHGPDAAPARAVAPAPVPAPFRAPAPTVVLQTYHNVYPRSGVSDAGWSSLERAKQHREGRVDRRNVLSNGAVTWDADVA